MTGRVADVVGEVVDGGRAESPPGDEGTVHRVAGLDDRGGAGDGARLGVRTGAGGEVDGGEQRRPEHQEHPAVHERDPRPDRGVLDVRDTRGAQDDAREA